MYCGEPGAGGRTAFGVGFGFGVPSQISTGRRMLHGLTITGSDGDVLCDVDVFAWPGGPAGLPPHEALPGVLSDVDIARVHGLCPKDFGATTSRFEALRLNACGFSENSLSLLGFAVLEDWIAGNCWFVGDWLETD